MRATERNPRRMMPRLEARIVARGRRVGRRVWRCGGGIRRARPWQRYGGLDHGKEHRPARRQRNPAGNGISGWQLLGRRIARNRRLLRSRWTASRDGILCAVVRSDLRRRLAVWIGPSKISGRCRRCRRRRSTARVGGGGLHRGYRRRWRRRSGRCRNGDRRGRGGSHRLDGGRLASREVGRRRVGDRRLRRSRDLGRGCRRVGGRGLGIGGLPDIEKRRMRVRRRSPRIGHLS